MPLKPSVFIIESLKLEDERKNIQEGRVLSEILHLAGKETEYKYIRTKKELRKILQQFKDSRMRYLHISCHGDGNSLALTLDSLQFQEFGELVGPHLSERRLFLSVCKAANKKLAKEIIPGTGCYSLIGPARGITFGDAALMWASFYHLMFNQNEAAMKRPDIRRILGKICATFGERMNYFGRKGKSPFFEFVPIEYREIG